MDKDALLLRLARLTATLTPTDKTDRHQLRRLRSELALWLVQNQESIPAAGTILAEGDLNETIFTAEFREELSRIIDDSQAASIGHAEGYRIVQRDLISAVDLSGEPATDWMQGQQAEHSLGPFVDAYGGTRWFDFFKPTPLHSISYKGDGAPFLKIGATNLFAIGSLREINLNPGSVWIRANYLNKQAPASSFVGLKIASGKISFNKESFFSGGNVLLEPAALCSLRLKLSPPQITLNHESQSAQDAIKASLNLPADVEMSFAFRKGSFDRVGDGDFRFYNHEFNVSYENRPCEYDQKLKRITLPVRSDSQAFSVNEVHSTLFKPFDKAEVESVSWALPLSIDDHSNLGEASGIGGYLLKSNKGQKAGWVGLKGGPVALNHASWLIEPGRIELHAFNAGGFIATQRLNLWWNNREAKRSSVSISLLKDFYLKYFCLGVEEAEMILTDVHLKGSLDKPLTADGERIKLDYRGVQFGFGKYKKDLVVQCVSRDNLKKLISSKKPEELRPLSMALSNAFAKISPCDEFILAGRVENDDSVESGVCGFIFGLYSLIPIFPDPYVANIQLNLESRRQTGLLRMQFDHRFQALVNWTDIAAPDLTFGLRLSRGALFAKIDSDRKSIYNRLKEKNSAKRVSHVIVTTDDDGNEQRIEVRASDFIEEDENNDNALKNHFTDFARGSLYPDLYVLDVSTNSDQFGVGLSNRAIEGAGFDQSFKFEGLELVTQSSNLQVVTLPPVQWEAVKTVQNPNVQPYPFPSPAHSLDTGDPAVISQSQAYHLTPVTAMAAIDRLISSFHNDQTDEFRRSAALINLPFGMKSLLRLERKLDQGGLYKTADVEYNQPVFKKYELIGGVQISLTAAPDNNNPAETPGFAGAAIQTRNLADKSNDVLGLSVLGPLVDTVFNNEFKVGGYDSRVPLKRIDLSGYGASIFSDWLNPDAQIATTSQARFDVIIGRTSHEVIQVRSKLYCCGANLVRTVTIQRTAGGGVTRHDSGWVAEGPGRFDFSHRLKGKTQKEPTPYVFHQGLVKGYYNITNIKDTLRIVEIPPLEAGDEKAQLQEVVFDADILIEDVTKGQTNSLTPSKGQKGFVQLAPAGRPISASQLSRLLMQEGPIGGPVDCLVNVARSGQEMRGIRVDTNRRFGSTVFVNAVRGSLILPNDGAWSVVRSKKEDVEQVQSNSGLPLIKYNSSPSKYEFTEPADEPTNQLGLMHSSDTHRTLFLKPYIVKNDPVITTEQPYFADLYALVNSNNVFPSILDVFTVGAGDGRLKIHGSGVLELISSGKMNIAPKPRTLHADASFKSYIEYFDKNNKPSEGSITINPADPEKWKTSINGYKLVYDISQHARVKSFHLAHYASATQRPKNEKPLLEFGSFLKPVGDMLRFLDTSDLVEFDIDPSNKNFHYKYKISYLIKIEFEAHKTPPFHHTKIVLYPKKAPKDWGTEKEQLRIFGLPALLPPISYFKGKFGVELYEDSKKGRSAVSIKLAAEMGVMVTSILEAIGVYAVGVVEYKAVFGGDLIKEHALKIALGCSVQVNLIKLGEIEAMRAVGVEYESESGDINALLIQKVEIGIATCTVGVTIEAKGPTDKIVEAIDPEKPLVTLNKIAAAFELTLTIELSAAFVINFEYEYTWKEIVPII
jgi:hypothetical protein